MLWKRGWELEDVHWCLKSRFHESLDVLISFSGITRYSIWWQLADKDNGVMTNCVIMIKLLCHASLLRSDNVRLKSFPLA